MAEEKKEESAKVRRPSAKKRDLQSIRRNLRNRGFNSRVANAVKEFKQAVETKKDAQIVQKQLAAVYSLMDKGVKTGILKLNQASRSKSRLAAQIAAAK